MATQNQPGTDSYYFVKPNPGPARAEFAKMGCIQEIKDILGQHIKRSEYIWYSEQIPETKDGDIFIEIPTDMIEPQQFLFDNCQNDIYDRATIQPLLLGVEL